MLIQKHILDKSDRFNDIVLYITALESSETTASPDNFLFFDIETTGLSADTSYLYLIGCMFLNENSEVELRQYFAEGIDEEEQLINEFEMQLKNHPYLVHFNGQTFDIPYIEKKRDLLGLAPLSFEYKSFDIYKKLKSLKKVLKLSSMSQKSLEKYIGLYREDKYDGGELIDFYNRYIAVRKLEALRSRTSAAYVASADSGLTQAGSQKSEELLEALLLHNFEDVQNMLEVSSLLSLAVFLRGGYEICSPEIDLCGNSAGPQLTIKLKLRYPLPCCLLKQSFLCSSDQAAPVRLNLNENAIITVPIIVSEFKRFYSDYKNYYYMPAEDNAVHKSIGEFLDKELRVKGSASNCYTRHTTQAVPIPGIMSKNHDFDFMVFKPEYNSKFGFMPLSELADDVRILEEYVALAINNIV